MRIDSPFLMILIAALFAMMDRGPLVPVTRDNRPEFIEVTSARLEEGSTKFEIILMPDGLYHPADVYIQIRDGDRNRFTARLALDKQPGKQEWRVAAWADDDAVRNGRLRITYGRTTGESSARNWSVALAEFAPEP